MNRLPDGPQLIHVGNAVVDLVITIPRLPLRGGDVLAHSVTTHAGGGFSVMAAAARHDLPVTYAGMHGTGQYAELTRAALREEGIRILQPPVPEVDTGVVLTFVDAGSERTFVTLPGAEAHLTPAALARVRARPGDILYVTGYSLAHTVNRAALTAWLPHVDPRVVVVVDPGPLTGALPFGAVEVLLDRADWLTANLAEAQTLTGAHDATSAALALALRTGRRGVIVRTGADGCLLVEKDHTEGTDGTDGANGTEATTGANGSQPGADGATATGAHTVVPVPGFPVTAVDLNGAGDTHTGVFLAELAQGSSAAEAAARANAAAALGVTRPGPATAPTRRQLDAFLDPAGCGARLPAHRA